MSAIGGKYELGERLGGGGMADVFRATVRGAEGFARPVAIKRIKRSISTDKGFGELFVSEARLAAKLHHPNVVQTLDFDRDEGGCFYLVMELIPGVDLRTLVASGRVPVSASCFIVSELLRALDYAHELVDDGRPITIIHRDISPHNIMLGWQGAVKVVDFGIAKAIEGSLVSRSGSLKGKVAYMSPEQIHGQELDGRSDLFAVGIVLYELLTGTRLFAAGTEAETLSRVLTQPIANPRSINDLVPFDLEEIVMRLLQRDRNDRYSRAREAMEELLDSSISITKGRRDMEALLLERFPERAPKRTTRLSNAPTPASGSSFEVVPVATADPGINDAVGIAATLRADRNDLGEKDTVPGRPASKPIPKRTFTAKPARELGDANTGESGAVPALVESHPVKPAAKSRASWGVVAVALAASMAGGFALLGGGDDEIAAPQEIAFVTADSGAGSAVNRSGTHAESDARAAEALSAQSGGVALDGGVIPNQTFAAAWDGGSVEQRGAKAIDADSRVEEKAVLTVRVKPWATIVVDGKNYGQTPQTVRLKEGKHRISLENSGIGKREKFSVSLEPGQVRTIEKDWR